MMWASIKVLITARTYPAPAKKGIEVSCTAGVTEDGRWIRLFPVPWRFLDEDKRFRKYQWIEARVRRSSDHRAESFTIDIDSIKILTDPLPSVKRWAERKQVVDPLLSPSLCDLQRRRNATKEPTLGFFKPREITRLVLEPQDPTWSERDQAKLRQKTLFTVPLTKELEQLPFKFVYHFKCIESTCRGHKLSCTDWEMGQAYRKWSQRYGDGWEEKFRQRFETEMKDRFDTHFFVGTTKSNPNAWIIVGLFYPLKASGDGEAGPT